MHDWPKVVIGKPVVIYGPPLDKDAHVREITTSNVVSIEEIEDDSTSRLSKD